MSWGNLDPLCPGSVEPGRHDLCGNDTTKDVLGILSSASRSSKLLLNEPFTSVTVHRARHEVHPVPQLSARVQCPVSA
jgi:hypothetical protein